MFRLLADENLNGDIVRGLLLRKPELDLVLAQEAGLLHAGDPDVLLWAADNGRLILTHDRATMPDYAYKQVAAGSAMPGVFTLHDKFPVGPAIQELLLILECSEPREWNGRVVYLPL